MWRAFAVRCGADDRQALERLCRTITRPALANERVQTNAAGQVVLKLKTAWRDGTTHRAMSPLEFLQRRCAPDLAPRLRPGPPSVRAGPAKARQSLPTHLKPARASGSRLGDGA